MKESLPTSAGDARWPWLLAFLFGWPLLVLCAVEVLGLATPERWQGFVPFFDAAAAIAIAWASAHLAIPKGAPIEIWVSVAVASLPLAVLFGIVASIGEEQLFFALAVVYAVGPALAVFLEGRRLSAALRRDVPAWPVT